jgi:hypothetical protein
MRGEAAIEDVEGGETQEMDTSDGNSAWLAGSARFSARLLFLPLGGSGADAATTPRFINVFT